MSRLVFSAIVVALVVPVALEAAERRTETNDGEPKNVAPGKGAAEFQKDPHAVEAYKGKRDLFTLYLIPGRWKQKETPSSPDAEVQFSLQDTDVFGLVIVDRAKMPVETLKQVAVGRVQRLDKDFRIVQEGKRIVNGRGVLFVILDAKIKGIPLTYFVYYYTGPEGSIQVLTFTSQSLFKEHKPDMEAFLNGFQLAPLPE